MNKQKRKKINKSNPMAKMIKNSQKFNNESSKDNFDKVMRRLSPGNLFG